MANNAKRSTRPTYMDYPKYDGLRVGCKVSWYYYRDKAMAEQANVAAAHNAKIQSALGYDFGYCSPGWRVEPAHANSEWAGMWEVCIP